MKLIQVTDIHIVPSGERLYGLDPGERLRACIDDINMHHGDAEFCVFTGDLADRGDVESYRVLAELLSGLSVPYRLMVGNHDDRKNLLGVFPETACDEHGFVQSVVRASAGDLVFLDTLDNGTDDGLLCANRLAWLRDRLAESGDRPVYLFMHHPPFDIAIPAIDRIRLKDSADLEAIIDGHGNIRHLFFGHVHRPVSGNWRGIPFSALRGTNHQVAFNMEILDRVPKSHEPPSYAIGYLDDDRTVIHFHDYLDKRNLVPGGDGNTYLP